MPPTFDRNTPNDEAPELESTLPSAPNLPTASHLTLTPRGGKGHVTTSITHG